MAFPTRMGCKQSDMFRIHLTEPEEADGVTLQDYHAAFLQSPFFQMELFFLSFVGTLTKETTSRDHLLAVAQGEKSSFGPWTTWAVEGSRQKPISASSDPVSACVLMRCFVAGKPFCDTWWAIEKTADCAHAELVFGTAMKLPNSSAPLTKLLVQVLDPFHRLYSRILLASAKAKLLEGSVLGKRD
jgi:hypothetical protein